MAASGARLRGPSARDQRERRILDVAAELLLQFGYRRVTIEDVASRAGIGKGTVYLHWRTRDDLFRAVLGREVRAAVDDVLVVLRSEPGAWRLHRFARAYFLAIMSRPLLRGLVLADADVIGRLAGPGGDPRDGHQHDRHQTVTRAYVACLADAGVLRDGLDADAVAFAFLAVLEGFLRADAPDGGGPAASSTLRQDRADLLAITVRNAFEADPVLSPRAEQKIASTVIDLIAALGQDGQDGQDGESGEHGQDGTDTSGGSRP